MSDRLVVVSTLLAPVLYWARCEVFALEAPDWSALSDDDRAYHRQLAEAALRLSEPEGEPGVPPPLTLAKGDRP